MQIVPGIPDAYIKWLGVYLISITISAFIIHESIVIYVDSCKNIQNTAEKTDFKPQKDKVNNNYGNYDRIILELYDSAAMKGDTESLSLLGNMYYYGTNVPVDKIKSYAYNQIAFKYGDLNGGQFVSILQNELNGKQMEEAQEAGRKLLETIENNRKKLDLHDNNEPFYLQIIIYWLHYKDDITPWDYPVKYIS